MPSPPHSRLRQSSRGAQQAQDVGKAERLPGMSWRAPRELEQESALPPPPGNPVQGVVIVRKRKGSFCSSSFGWRSELLHVETAKCYEPLQQRTKTAQMRSNFGAIWESRTEVFVSRCVELLWFMIVITMIIVTIMINNIDNSSFLPSLFSAMQRFFTKGGQSMNDALAAVVEAQSKKVSCSSKARRSIQELSAENLARVDAGAKVPLRATVLGEKLQPHCAALRMSSTAPYHALHLGWQGIGG